MKHLAHLKKVINAIFWFSCSIHATHESFGFPNPPDYVPPLAHSDPSFRKDQDRSVREDIADGDRTFHPQYLRISPTKSLAGQLGYRWWVEGEDRYIAILTLGLEKTVWQSMAYTDFPIVLMLQPIDKNQNKVPIMLSKEAAEYRRLSAKFKYAKISMDDVHLWMKVGTGFTRDDIWLRIEFVRPPPTNRFEKTEGNNWYITLADNIIYERSEAEPIKFTSLLDILNAMDEVGIPIVRDGTGESPYSALPGWVPRQYWNCYTALNELNDRLGIVDNLSRPFQYHLISLLTMGSATGRRHGSDILTPAARKAEVNNPSIASRERRQKYYRECGFSSVCDFFMQQRKTDESVAVSLTSHEWSFLQCSLFGLIIFGFVYLLLFQKRKRKYNGLKLQLLQDL